jgi:SNF2 family DNA or RNA helicase
MKNPTTKIALAIFRLKGEVRVSLSGTPVENHLVELWSHFHFLQRDLFTNRDLFEKGALNEIPPQQLKKIAMQIKPFFLKNLYI